jgi:hypothetical protein
LGYCVYEISVITGLTSHKGSFYSVEVSNFLRYSQKSKMHKKIYLDTNIFLHCKPFDQIDWLEIVSADSATIVIPPITLRELNKHKDSHSRAHMRKRAGEVIKRLSVFLNSGPNALIREKVFISFEDRDPTIDFSVHQLNPNVQDDYLIASIIMNKQELPTDHIILVTSDLGLTLVAKAGRQGIDTVRMPEILQLAEEPDPFEKEIKQLKQQILEMSSRIPKLTLTYQDGNQYVRFKFHKPIILEQQEIDQKINEFTQKFQKREQIEKDAFTQLSTNKPETIARIAPRALMDIIPKEEIDRYINDAENYIRSYMNYMTRCTEYENLKNRTIRVDILLANDGTSPAEDVDINMHFPDGFQILEVDKFPNPPRPPELPSEPMTTFEKYSKFPNFIYPMIERPIPSSVNHSFQSESIPNVSGLSIKRTNSYDVHTHVQRAKHNLDVNLDPLFVVFDSFDTAKSFSVEYQIIAANIPNEVVGKLHVIVLKD